MSEPVVETSRKAHAAERLQLVDVAVAYLKSATAKLRVAGCVVAADSASHALCSAVKAHRRLRATAKGETQ